MIKLFNPNKYVKDYRYVDLVQLKKQGIKLIICDIDNTLVAHDESHPNEAVIDFVNRVKATGFAFCLISNNFNERVTTFAQDLHVPTYPMAKKPLKLTYRKIMKEMGYQASEIASIGDQIMTDVLGGNRMHMYTILTSPLVQRDITSTKINRKFENIVFKWLAKKGYLVKGEFNE
ncbi:MAG: YqeG family HAD IIIA-type phosphatase [Erysipelotrichia bacterium]|nr:YqeG family HAD IIIA-type phosphatase [Erysipelotrichia bacterium]NCC54278.1 YqeG family HAD IIIA-type phosphatase [Erysipelotrichia bacterium]